MADINLRKYKVDALGGFPPLADFNIKKDGVVNSKMYALSGYVYFTETGNFLVEYVAEDDLLIAPVAGTA